jgi:hypothetical protein
MKIRHIDVRVQDLNFDYFLDELVAGVLEKGSQVQDSFREREIMAQLVFTQGFLRNPNSRNLERFVDRLANNGQESDLTPSTTISLQSRQSMSTECGVFSATSSSCVEVCLDRSRQDDR